MDERRRGGKRYIIKAREHHGTASLNLTIPAKVRREYKIEPGDFFELRVEERQGDVVLIYRRLKEYLR